MAEVGFVGVDFVLLDGAGDVFGCHLAVCGHRCNRGMCDVVAVDIEVTPLVGDGVAAAVGRLSQTPSRPDDSLLIKPDL